MRGREGSAGVRFRLEIYSSRCNNRLMRCAIVVCSHAIIQHTGHGPRAIVHTCCLAVMRLVLMLVLVLLLLLR